MLQKDRKNNRFMNIEDVRRAWKRLTDRLASLPFMEDRITRVLVYTIVFGLIGGLVTLSIYDRIHCFTDYSITSQAEENDVDGTLYQMLGSHIIKYSHDGLFCVNTKNEMIWSSAYTMQTPISAVCGSTMVVAEQRGTQIYVLNEDGIIGSFDTTLPIVRVCVSKNGETAVILDDSDVSWINLYQKDGTLIASVKTTMEGSGYPTAVAVTPNAKRMMISFLVPKSGSLGGRIDFYDFSSLQDADADHLTASYQYEDMVFPEVYYADESTPVAVGDAGYVVFTGGKAPEEKTQVSLDAEIVSTFHDSSSLGFIFHSTQRDIRYHMEVYNLNGRQMMETDFDFEYEDVRMENDEILLYDASDLNVYRTSGKAKLKVTYKKAVSYFASLSGLRKYLVITDSSMDRINLS